MIEIIGPALVQWDVGRVARIDGIEADSVHLANRGDSRAVIMEIVDGQAKIPDYLLQTGKPVCVYAVKDGITIYGKTFHVQNRERPENYVYEDDQRNYIYELISKAEDAADRANDAAERANDAADRIPDVSVTHKWDGTVLEVTSASGTSSADLKGPKGDPGKSVTITHIAENAGDGASNMVWFSDGKTLTIKNGSKGSPGTTPHIGENGNWWIGETDTGVSAGGSGGTGGIPLPETASAGQFIMVSAVDENGVVVATEAVDAPTLPAAEGVAF